MHREIISYSTTSVLRSESTTTRRAYNEWKNKADDRRNRTRF